MPLIRSYVLWLMAAEVLQTPSPYYPRVCVRIDAALKSQTWKCWRYTDGSVLWELWGILDAFIPNRNTKSPDFRINKLIQKENKDWVDHLIHEGKALHQVFEPSLRSLAARGVECSSRTHDTPSMSTYGLLSLFTWVATMRTEKVKRAAANCLEALLGFCLVGVRESEFTLVDLLNECKGLCNEFVDGGLC